MTKFDVIRDYRKDKNYVLRSYQILLIVTVVNLIISYVITQNFRDLMPISEKININLAYILTHGATAGFLRSHQFLMLTLQSRFAVVNALMRFSIILNTILK